MEPLLCNSSSQQYKQTFDSLKLYNADENELGADQEKLIQCLLEQKCDVPN